jgi:hypothetical protein
MRKFRDQLPSGRLLAANSVNDTLKKVHRREVVFSSSWIFCFREEGALLPALILGSRRRRGRAPMKYDSVYPTFRLARQARSRLGGKLRRNHLAAMPDLWMRFDHWARTSPQAGARCIPRLDRDSARSLPWLREDLHFPPAAFSPLHPLQFADARSGIAAAPCGALFLGGGDAYAQRSQPRARCFHASSLGPASGPLSTGSFLSPANTRARQALAGAW